MKPAELVEPDPRWQRLVGDKSGLEAAAASWRVSSAVPDGVASVLRIARLLFVHSYFVYEFSLTAVTWGLLVLEASLRDCLQADERIPFARLIRDAESRSLLSHAEAEAIDAGRELRNRIVHGQLLVTTLTPAVVGEMLAATHDAISDLYERVAEEPTP
jgi:hypothetical protein